MPTQKPVEAKVKKVPRQRPKLTTDLLLSNDGLSDVLEHIFHMVKIKSRGHEVHSSQQSYGEMPQGHDSFVGVVVALQQSQGMSQGRDSPTRVVVASQQSQGLWRGDNPHEVQCLGYLLVSLSVSESNNFFVVRMVNNYSLQIFFTGVGGLGDLPLAGSLLRVWVPSIVAGTTILYLLICPLLVLSLVSTIMPLGDYFGGPSSIFSQPLCCLIPPDLAFKGWRLPILKVVTKQYGGNNKNQTSNWCSFKIQELLTSIFGI
eukprot:Gb_05154 [translate_table: standard]